MDSPSCSPNFCQTHHPPTRPKSDILEPTLFVAGEPIAEITRWAKMRAPHFQQPFPIWKNPHALFIFEVSNCEQTGLLLLA